HAVRHDYSWWINYATFSISYVGLLPLVLCLFARSWRDRLLLIAAVVLYLTAMDWTAIGRLMNAIPPLSIVANDKLRFACVFFVAIVAGKLLDRVEWQVGVASVVL